MIYAKCCDDCVMNNDNCLLQSNNDVEDCEDYREMRIKMIKERDLLNSHEK